MAPETPLRFPMHAIILYTNKPLAHRYRDCAATISRLIFVKDSSNLAAKSSDPITLPACAICLSNSSKRRKSRIRDPS